MKIPNLYPCIKEVCELYDLQLSGDWVGNELADLSDGHEVVYIEQPRELSAGIYGFRFTPCFLTIEALEAFCERNISRFREQADALDFPDPTSWEHDTVMA